MHGFPVMNFRASARLKLKPLAQSELFSFRGPTDRLLFLLVAVSINVLPQYFR
jgi:hypothetical protein